MKAHTKLKTHAAFWWIIMSMNNHMYLQLLITSIPFSIEHRTFIQEYNLLVWYVGLENVGHITGTVMPSD